MSVWTGRARVLRGWRAGSILQTVEILGELDRRLQYGVGMRAQRFFEASLLVATFFTGEVRFAYVTLALNALQVISPRLAPIAVAVSLVVKPPEDHALGDLYFDLAGTRGASLLATIAQGMALLL